MMTQTRFIGGLFAAFIQVLAMLVLFVPDSQAAGAPRNPLNGRQSYSGSNMSCLIANDFYAVHFTAMQQGRQAHEKSDFEKYCQEIPATGRVYLSIDLLDRDVRSTPIALTVVEENLSENGGEATVKATLAQLPAKIYKNGTADIQVDISKPGHYALMAVIGDEVVTEDDRLRVPFSVGLPPPTSYSQWFGRFTGALVVIFFGVMGVIGFRTWRAYRPKAAEPAEGI